MTFLYTYFSLGKKTLKTFSRDSIEITISVQFNYNSINLLKVDVRDLYVIFYHNGLLFLLNSLMHCFVHIVNICAHVFIHEIEYNIVTKKARDLKKRNLIKY